MKRISNLHGVVLIIFLGSLSLFLSSCGGGGSSGTSAAPPAPNPVVSVGVSAVAGNNKVSLGWSSVATTVSYDIYSSTSSTQAGSKIASVAAPTTMYIDNSAANGITYYYVVKAKDNGGVLIGTSTQVSATPTSSSGVVIVSGTVLYQDKEYGVNGFTGNQPYKAVRYAAVELVSALTNSPLVSALTDSTGFYSISTSPTTTVYVRVNADATLSGVTPQIVIRNLSALEYAVAGNNFPLSGSANVNISIPTTLIGGAFNILDVFTNGFEFVHGLAGVYPPAALTGYWQTSNPNGTYYCSSGCPQGTGIYIFNNPTGDTDEYDDDVLYHEFGHFTAAQFSHDDSQGGAHRLTDNDLDMRLAWSEGWGDSFPGTVKMWLYTTGQQNLLSSAPGVALTEYIDTTGSTAGIAIDIDNPDGAYGYNAIYFSYASGEVAIAKILLDMNQHFGMQNVWDVIADFKATPPSTPVNLELFWDRWHSLLSTSPIDSFFTNRLIFYSPDFYEPADGSITSASTYTVNITGAQNHTLYPNNDVDYVSFLVTSTTQTYTAKTSSLKNGADTYLSIFSSPTATIPVASNDNSPVGVTTDPVYSPLFNCDSFGICHENGNDLLGSRISFVPATTGTYYVKVSSSSTRPVSAGRYGSYTLTITSP